MELLGKVILVATGTGVALFFLTLVGWIVWKFFDDLLVWTNFSKGKIFKRIPKVSKDRDQYGNKKPIEYPCEDISHEDALLAGLVAIAQAAVIGSVLIGIAIFFGEIVTALGGNGEDGWSLF